MPTSMNVQNPYGAPHMSTVPSPMGPSPPMGMGPPGSQQQQIFNPQQLLNDPMASMALGYGNMIAGQGRQIVNEKIEKYVSISKLKSVRHAVTRLYFDN